MFNFDVGFVGIWHIGFYVGSLCNVKKKMNNDILFMRHSGLSFATFFHRYALFPSYVIGYHVLTI